MNWRNVKLIFLREVRDQLRDRRTLFMVAVLPLLLYPALGIGMVQLTLMFSEQPRTAVLLGSAQLPSPALLQAGRFREEWFRNPGDASRLRLITDSPADAVSHAPAEEGRSATNSTASAPAARDAEALEAARRIRAELVDLRRLEHQLRQTEHAAAQARQKLQETIPDAADMQGAQSDLLAAAADNRRLQEELVRAREGLSQSFAQSEVQAIIIIPDDFSARIAALGQKLHQSEGAAANADLAPVEILYNKADDKSLITYNRIHTVLENWEQALVKSQLQAARLPLNLIHPVRAEATNVATDSQSSASVWAKIFPALLIIMAITGAFYPAIDLCAGEKERGTMETLLICPASRTEIVLGKFFAVMTFSSSTAVLNLLSMGMTGQHMLTMAPRGILEKSGDMSLPGFHAMLWIVILLIPLSALFSALSLAVATFARSSKEGQYYLTPLLMVTMGLTVFCLSPGVELRPIYSITPVVGIALLLKELLLAPLNSGLLTWYALPVLLTSFGYSALALWWAIDQFNREEVLFREAERLDLSLWVRHLLRDKEPVPSFTEAGFCFVLIMLLQFVAMKAFASPPLELEGPGTIFPAMYKALLIQQLAIIGCTSLLMGIMLTTSLKETFRLRVPEWKVLAAAVLLPVCLHPLTVELQGSLGWFFGPLPDGVHAVLKGLTDTHRPIWILLVVFAGVPAVCEEIAFRGFILSGFDRRHRTWLAIAVSSIAFGVMHMIPQQVFNASLLGLVLGVIAIRGNSLWPCIAFHFTNNSLAVLHARLPDWLSNAEGVRTALYSVQEGQLRYSLVTLLLCALVAAPILSWLIGGISRLRNSPQAVWPQGISADTLATPANR